MNDNFFDSLEVKLRSLIDPFMISSTDSVKYNIKSEYTELLLNWETQYYGNINFSIKIWNDYSICRFDINTTDENIEYPIDFKCKVELMASEEEYFQMSTVEGLGFRWEFYQYLTEIFKVLQYK